MNNHKAIILAGGKGTRLYPITYEIPKPLLPVQKKPIINHMVDLFLDHGVSDIAVLINKSFKEEFDWWKKRYYSDKDLLIKEEDTPLGTLGGLLSLKDWISDSKFFFSNGDELKKVNLCKMSDFHSNNTFVGTVALVKVPNPQDYGVIVCKEGVVREFLEKPENPPSSYISSGLYMFSPEVFNYHPGSKFCMVEKDLFPRLAKDSKLGGFEFEGEWMDCGTFERYENALKNWNKNNHE